MDRTIHPMESAIHPVAFAKHPMKGPTCSFRDAPASLEGIRRRASALTLCHITHSRTARHFQPPHSMPRWHHGAWHAVVRPPWGRTWGRHAVRGFAMLTRGYRIVRPIQGRQQHGGRTSPPHVPQTFKPTRSRAAHIGPATSRHQTIGRPIQGRQQRGRHASPQYAPQRWPAARTSAASSQKNPRRKGTVPPGMKEGKRRGWTPVSPCA